MRLLMSFHCSEVNPFTRVTVAGDCGEEMRISATSSIGLWLGSLHTGYLLSLGVGQSCNSSVVQTEETEEACDGVSLPQLTSHMGESTLSLNQATNCV